LATVLGGIEIRPARIPVVANESAQVVSSPEQIRSALVANWVLGSVDEAIREAGAIPLRWVDDWSVPVAGRSGWASLVMPMVTLGMGTLGRLTQLARSVMLDTLGQDYIRTAWAKGLAPRAVQYRHALKNAAIPLITLIGVNFGYMLGGAVLIESVFSYPGIGRLAAQAIFQRDFPLVQAVAFFASLVVILVNLATDLVYGLVNPQVRLR